MARSPAVDPQVEEVGRAGDARVVVADGLLADPGQLLVVEIEPVLDEPAQVVLDGPLVLGRRRDDARTANAPVSVDVVPVVEDAAGCYGHAVAGGCARRHRDGHLDGRAVFADQPESLLDRAHDLYGAP